MGALCVGFLLRFVLGFCEWCAGAGAGGQNAGGNSKHGSLGTGAIEKRVQAHSKHHIGKQVMCRGAGCCVLGWEGMEWYWVVCWMNGDVRIRCGILWQVGVFQSNGWC